MARNEQQPRTLIISPPESFVEADDRSNQSDFPSELDSASITASVLDYEFENGRRYHAYKAGSYPLPNDEAELERIDLKHHVAILLAGGHLHISPLNDPRRILDVGTGTGIWAIEMAEQYPNAQIIGTDLSPVQPTWVPDNVHFEIDDCESRYWSWPEDHFDFIHSRFMIASIGNWQALVRKAYKHCKPGGYFELQELDCRFKSDDATLSSDSNLSYWSEVITEAAANYNRPIPRYTEYYGWFEKAGFVDIQQYIFKSPTNPWPKLRSLKEAGQFQLTAHIQGLEGISLGLLTRGLGWKAEEVSVLMAKMRPEVFVVGRKPEPPSSVTSRHSSTAPPTPRSFSSSVIDSPPDHGQVLEELNSFTPTVGMKRETLVEAQRQTTDPTNVPPGNGDSR
ncbi:MAG: hypothetical protein Q9190_002608 [Brigantiaea leucoxantha]